MLTRVGWLTPTFGLLLLALLAKLTGIDFWVADHFADGAEGFPWRHAWLTQELLHDGGAWLIRAYALVLLALVLFGHPPLRRIATYLLLTTALTTGSVSLIKHAIDKDCPWDLDRYGGSRPTLHLLYGNVPGKAPGHCFPGGHSSGGFSLLGLYFVMRRYRPAWASRVLLMVTFVGGGFALTQWMRGAHFVSHDLTSAAMAWLVAALLQPLLPAQLSPERAD